MTRLLAIAAVNSAVLGSSVAWASSSGFPAVSNQLPTFPRQIFEMLTLPV